MKYNDSEIGTATLNRMMDNCPSPEVSDTDLDDLEREALKIPDEVFNPFIQDALLIPDGIFNPFVQDALLTPDKNLDEFLGELSKI